jgi:hypothetical protein
MKNFFGCILAGILLVSGCVSTPSTRPPMTEAQRVDRLAFVLKTTVSSVVTLAAEDREQSTRDTILKARNLVNTLVSEGNTNPRDIVEALSPLWRDAKPEVRIAANAALGLLQVYFDDYVFEVPQGNENAVKFLKAVVAGIDEGLATAPPVVH